MAKTDDVMDLVCDTAGDLAFKQLGEYGDFLPFAVAIDRSNSLRIIALGDDQVEDGGEQDLLKIRSILRTRAHEGEIIATGVVSDVRVRRHAADEIGNAVRIEVEHSDHEPITYILPYRITDQTVEQHAEPYFIQGDRDIFS